MSDMQSLLDALLPIALTIILILLSRTLKSYTMFKRECEAAEILFRINMLRHFEGQEDAIAELIAQLPKSYFEVGESAKKKRDEPPVLETLADGTPIIVAPNISIRPDDYYDFIGFVNPSEISEQGDASE